MVCNSSLKAVHFKAVQRNVTKLDLKVSLDSVLKVCVNQYSFLSQSVDQTVCMQRLICAVIVCISKQEVFT